MEKLVDANFFVGACAGDRDPIEPCGAREGKSGPQGPVLGQKGLLYCAWGILNRDHLF